jgi:hypothetical protein
LFCGRVPDGNLIARPPIPPNSKSPSTSSSTLDPLDTTSLITTVKHRLTSRGVKLSPIPSKESKNRTVDEGDGVEAMTQGKEQDERALFEVLGGMVGEAADVGLICLPDLS